MTTRRRRSRHAGRPAGPATAAAPKAPRLRHDFPVAASDASAPPSPHRQRRPQRRNRDSQSSNEKGSPACGALRDRQRLNERRQMSPRETARRSSFVRSLGAFSGASSGGWNLGSPSGGPVNVWRMAWGFMCSGSEGQSAVRGFCSLHVGQGSLPAPRRRRLTLRLRNRTASASFPESTSGFVPVFSASVAGAFAGFLKV